MNLISSFDPTTIEGFHAHVYYRDSPEKDVAALIREEVQQRFDVIIGRWRDEPVGPHPQAMFQIAFESKDLGLMIPWLMSVRGPLSILVHASTGLHDRLDPSTGACWLGQQLALNLDFFEQEEGKST